MAIKRKSEIEETLALHIRAAKLPAPTREFRFHPTRKWRFDFAWPELRFAVETEGGTFSNGRHTRGLGFDMDCTKYSEAMILGWDVYRCSGGMVRKGMAIDFLKRLFEERGWR